MTGIALFGCGRIGRLHAANLARTPGVTLVCVYDVMQGAANALATELGTSVAPSIEAALNDERVDAVLIATSTDTHTDLILQSVAAGKYVLCEKPVDLELQRAIACRDRLGTQASRVMMGFNRRFDPSFEAVRRRLEAGEIGRLEQVIITSRDPSPPPPAYIRVSGGLFRDMTIHDFDMSRFIAGNIVDVSATGGCLVDPEIGALGDIDSAMITMKSATGALVHINNSRRAVYGYDQRLEVFGSDGLLLAKNRHETTVEASGTGFTGRADPAAPFFLERYSEAYRAEIARFVTCIRDETPFPVTLDDGIAALRLAQAAQESLASSKTVTIDDRA
ncbi:myo-inositol 2-dehydrogenase [Ameyamaea chiangmaiensis NBRC 103196]|uniref:Inositol 2-dehydrogenase n=1 Tax=Ameyamaea chiangmaiensis TaxID=442969 RepID=A0A850P843_9PROT|nr:inositol 2-dehydrogenase [Ameyamaea chiangmaiensis]MBS4075036.1 inositol 2-dehydrogenase [Ameyamaea chiangmaiensis]NVN40078.1 inositol 2-dehydrogenase [Ameyamaea chiangmaiensis]GBQ65697.1 myo-inositol 2-dehydrogenase [Ameyamaea chiangmaiensis NBRC 103196]